MFVLVPVHEFDLVWLHKAKKSGELPVGTAIPPRYGGDFPSLGGIPPGLQTPQGGETPPMIPPPYRGGFLDFEGGSGGTAKI